MALSLSSMAAAAQESAAAATPASASIAHSAAQQCRAHPTVNACDDAIRWNPSDPALLAAMGDSLMRVRRPADALRSYQRAASLAPDTPGIQAKIAAAQGSSAKSKTAKSAAQDAANAAAQTKRFSNSDPDSQTH